MKKFVIVIILFALALYACNPVAGPSWAADVVPVSGSSSAALTLKEPVTLSWGSAVLGSTSQMVISAIATVVSQREAMLRLSDQSTSGFQENIRLLRNHELNIACNSSSYDAFHQLGDFAGEPPVEMWALMTVACSNYVVCVLKDSNFKSIFDLEGKKVCFGAAGGGNYTAASQLFDAHGLLDKIQIETMSYADANDALIDGSLDAFVGYITGVVPMPSLAQLDTAVDIRLLPLDVDMMKEYTKSHFSYEVREVQAGCLKHMSEPYVTMGGSNIAFADHRLSDAAAYTLLKTIYSNLEELYTYHQLCTNIKLADTLSGLPKEIPIHPGAATYLKEQGIWDDGWVIATR